MALSKLEAHLLHDKRLHELMTASGELTEKDWDKFTASLPDLTGQTVEIQVYEEPTEEVHSTFEPA